MSLSSPLWLLALLPWAAAVLLLLIGRLKRVPVPFLHLWQGPEAIPRRRKGIQLPPIWILLAILATLLAILAASQPVIRTPLTGPPLTILIDRGITMSAGKPVPRFHEAVDLAFEPINQALRLGPVELLAVPPIAPIHTDRSDWTALAKAIPPTAINTAPSLRAALLQTLAQPSTIVVVLSDQPLNIQNERLVQIPPQSLPQNVAITHFAARQKPTPQVMLRIRNDSPITTARLRISSDGAQLTETPIQLPPNAQRDLFADLPSLGRSLAATLDVDDDWAADNHAFLLRQSAWPIVEPHVTLPPEIDRIVQLYSRLRPPSPDSKHLAIVAPHDSLPATDPAAILAQTAASATATQPSQPLRVIDHPITNAVSNWPAVDPPQPPSDPNWQTLVSNDGRTLVAIRDTPSRAVWIGFHSSPWATTPDFAIFWINVLNWLGQGSHAYSADLTRSLPASWKSIQSADPTPPVSPGLWPGIYQLADGSMLALNAPTFPFANPLPSDWRQTLYHAARSAHNPHRGLPLAPFMLLAAIAVVTLSALTWKPPQPTSRPAPQPPKLLDTPA